MKYFRFLTPLGFAFLFLFAGVYCRKKSDPVCEPDPSRKIITIIRSNGIASTYSYQQVEGCPLISRIGDSNGTERIYKHEIGGTAIQINVYKSSGDMYASYLMGYTTDLGPTDGLCPRHLADDCAVIQGPLFSYRYNSDGNLKEVTKYANGITTNDIYTWEEGNLIASVTAALGTQTFEYYTDKINTLGNEYLGQSFLGRSSRNLIKREVRYTNNGNTILDYAYEFDENCYVTKRTITTSDETGNILETSWAIYTYEQ